MQTQQKLFLKADSIYRYLMGISDRLDTLVMCKPENVILVTYDQSIYEALGAIKDRNNIDYNKLVKLLEVVDVQSFKEKVGERNILKQERVKELRGEVSGAPEGEIKDFLGDEKNE